MFNFILYPFCFSCYALFVLKDLVQLKFPYSKQRKLLLTFYAHHLIFFLGTIAASIYDNAESCNFMMPCLRSTDYITKTDIEIRTGGIEILNWLLSYNVYKNDHGYTEFSPKIYAESFCK